jgi:glycosyltransferase involved in cell wall biosynthesis
MTSPLVSVILSVRNGVADVPMAVDTILTQTFADFELIAINNGSTDGAAIAPNAGITNRKTTPPNHLVTQNPA